MNQPSDNITSTIQRLRSMISDHAYGVLEVHLQNGNIVRLKEVRNHELSPVQKGKQDDADSKFNR